MRREEIWDYPLDAIREAVANALIHRDYLEKREIAIKVYDTSILFTNPGGLPEGLTTKDLKKPSHHSIRRNRLLAEAFYRAGFVEKWGTGTYRILRSLKKVGLPQPNFQSDVNMSLWFYRNEAFLKDQLENADLNKRQLKAIQYIKSKGQITNKEHKEHHKISIATATRDLKELMEKGFLIKVGTRGRYVHYIIPKSN